MDEKTKENFLKEIAELLRNYLYENCGGAGVNYENVILVAPYIELNEKLAAIAKKYEVII